MTIKVQKIEDFTTQEFPYWFVEIWEDSSLPKPNHRFLIVVYENEDKQNKLFDFYFSETEYQFVTRQLLKNFVFVAARCHNIGVEKESTRESNVKRKE